MADYKANKFFFESNQFLSQPLLISLLQNHLFGKLNRDDEAKLRILILELKVELKEEKHPELSKQRLGRQFRFLHYLKNKQRLQERGIWEDDITRELEMKQEEGFQKQAKDTIHKLLKDGNVDVFSFLREPTVKLEEIQDLNPIRALDNSALAVALTMEAETYSKDETGVEEPPPCPVDLV